MRVRRATSCLLATLALCCGGPRSPDSGTRPASIAVSAVPDRTACRGGETRLGNEACSRRSNSGMKREDCVDGKWRESEQCVCTGTVKFKSAVLEQKILEKSKLEGPLSVERAAELTELKIHNAGIDSLEGLECFRGLVELDLGRNRLSDLEPLSELSGLQKLELYDNDIRDLEPLGKLVALVKLSVAQNEIWDIAPLATLPALAELSLYDNHVSDLSPLRGHSQLRYLGVSQNCVSDLSPIAELSGLETLSVGFNAVRDASPLRGMRGLHNLFLDGNGVKDLTPIGELPALKYLFVDSNGLSDVSPLTKLRDFVLVNVQRNLIDCKAQAKNILLLEQNAKQGGGEVHHDCSPKRQRAIRLGLDREFNVWIKTEEDELHLTLPRSHDKNRCAPPKEP